MTVSSERAPTVYQLPAPSHSFGRMLWQLPGQYWRILTRPAPESIAAGSSNPNWGIVWLQLMGMATFSGSVAILSGSFVPPALTAVQLSDLSSMVDPKVVQQVLNASPTIQVGLTFLVTFLSQIIGFFLLTGSLHLVSVTIMGGRGSFRSLSYNMLLVTLPLMLVTSSLGTNPYLVVLSVIGAIYMLVLQTMAAMATYRLSVGRALGGFVLPLLVLAAVFLAVAVLISAVILLVIIQIL